MGRHYSANLSKTIEVDVVLERTLEMPDPCTGLLCSIPALGAGAHSVHKNQRTVLIQPKAATAWKVSSHTPFSMERAKS